MNVRFVASVAPIGRDSKRLDRSTATPWSLTRRDARDREFTTTRKGPSISAFADLGSGARLLRYDESAGRQPPKASFDIKVAGPTVAARERSGLDYRLVTTSLCNRATRSPPGRGPGAITRALSSSPSLHDTAHG